MAQVADAYKGMATVAQRPATMLDAGGPVPVTVNLGSATDLPPPTGTVDAVVTDPPYYDYDNVMYGECAD